MRTPTKLVVVTCILASVAVGVRAEEGAEPAPGLVRVAGTIQIQGDPEGLGEVAVVRAFPNLTFQHPVWVGHPGDGTDRLFVAERGGRLFEFKNDARVKRARKSLDISKKVMLDHVEEGVLGLAFHPDVRKNRRLYISYIGKRPDGREQVVSQFTMNPQRTFVRAKSEKPLIRMPKPWGNGNGGCIQFGPDGQLYISVGDGGGSGDPNDHAQDLGNWFGSLLRVDPESGAKFKASEGNPYDGVRRAQSQIWAFGFRDLKRFSFDRVTGQCWGGDVGEGLWQEIDLIEKGGNYGWNIRQGSHEFREGTSLVPLKDPLIEHGNEDARSITGGLVYRGTRLPGLSGAYVYGDEATGNIWMLRADGKRVLEHKLVARGLNVTCFGEDANGEIVFVTRDGKIYTLAPGEAATSSEFPRRLSHTGLFTDTLDLTPHPSLIPYDINTPLWSDGAQKERYVMLPGNQKITVRKDGTYAFPQGTIFVKTFFHGDAEEGARLGHRLETRLLLLRDRGWEGYTYVWNPEQNDAHLVDGRLSVDMYDSAESDSMFTWTLPSRSDCASCHTKVSNEVLGFRTEALQRSHDFGSGPEDQLAALQRAQVFEKLPKGPRWPDWHSDEDGPSEASIRAYLDMNCAMCHQPNGPGNANIDLRFDTPLSKTNLVGTKPGIWHLGIQDARLLVPGSPERSLLLARMKRTDIKGMPPTSHNVLDETALKRIHDWIAAMKK